jgi:hypothetical protein
MSNSSGIVPQKAAAQPVFVESDEAKEQRRLAALAAAEKREIDSSKFKGSSKAGVRSNNKTGIFSQQRSTI